MERNDVPNPDSCYPSHTQEIEGPKALDYAEFSTLHEGGALQILINSGGHNAKEKVTLDDMFLFHSMDKGDMVDVPYTMAKFLFDKAKGYKEKSLIFRVHMIGRIARYSRLGLGELVDDHLDNSEDEAATAKAREAWDEEGGKMPCVSSDVATPIVSAYDKYAIDVKPIPPRIRNNIEVHLDYLKHLKESVETLHEIVEKAKIVLLYLDSGCSKHMIEDRSRLRNFVKKFIEIVRFRNDHFGAIIGYGDYVIGDSVISRVYYVEGLAPNLFSVSQFCDSNLEVAFTKHTCFVKDLDGGDLIKACQLGKSKKYTHKPKTVNTIMEVLHTLHMDLCGPMRVQRKTIEFVIKLLKQLQVGLNKTVKNIRTDNDTKFVNQHLIQYYERVGISHQKSVPRTPQPDDVVERQNRTLVEAARTMLIFYKAPMLLWAEAIACYTQNRSLIHTLHNKTPYELVHDKKHDLSFLLVFGALCYPTNDNEDLEKLKAKADSGFFVGYTPNKKGYQIYNKRTRQIMETICVTFDELTEQTTHIHSSSGPSPNLLTPGPISSGLVPKPTPAVPYVPPTNKELGIFFQSMFDEYFEPPTVNRPVPPALAAQVLDNPTSPFASIFVDQDAPLTSHSPSSSDL
nr:retrovirus-related Pol polyprotein from transposon TNT 1-94 [Tanacetum cinerariifolium]